MFQICKMAGCTLEAEYGERYCTKCRERVLVKVRSEYNIRTFYDLPNDGNRQIYKRDEREVPIILSPGLWDNVVNASEEAMELID